MSELGDLFNLFQTDKTSKHGYEEVYERSFKKRRDQKINILEIGVYQGSSTMALHKYFPNANLYGADVFERFTMETIKPYKFDRCKFVKADSTSENFGEKIKEAFGEDIKFDYIIDDGKHTPLANMLTFTQASPFLADGGEYFIEDVWPLHIMYGDELDHYWLRAKPEVYNSAVNNEFLTTLEMSDLKIVKFDLRKKSGEPDSYIIRLKK